MFFRVKLFKLGFVRSPELVRSFASSLAARARPAPPAFKRHAVSNILSTNVQCGMVSAYDLRKIYKINFLGRAIARRGILMGRIN